MRLLLTLILVCLLAPNLLAADKDKATVISRVFMEYPAEARRQHMEGRGVFVLHVDPSGRVTKVVIGVSTGHRLLDETAIRNLLKFRFTPGTPSVVKIPANYTLDKS